MFRVSALLVALVSALTGCGGGGDGSSGVVSAAQIATRFSVDPATVLVTSNTTTTPFSNVRFGTLANFTAWGSTCPITTGNYPVLETANAIVYNSGAATATDLDNAARYTDAAIATLRNKYSLPGSVGLDGANKFKVCVTTTSDSGSSAGYNDLFVQTYTYPNKDSLLADLILHEMTHALQAHALHCTLDQYGFERWLTEGMALNASGQNLPSKSALSGLQTLFSGGTPFADTWNRNMPNNDRYPGYALAYKTFLGEYGKTDIDVYNFLTHYGSTVGCPSSGNSAGTWKTEFDAYFGTDLRGTGVLGSTFWANAPKYAL
jgi:hypothetical protein